MRRFSGIIMNDDEPVEHNVLWLRKNDTGIYSLWFFNNGKWNQLSGGYKGPSYIPGEGGIDIDDLKPEIEEIVGEYFEAVKQYLEDNERVIANALARHEQWINDNTFPKEDDEEI